MAEEILRCGQDVLGNTPSASNRYAVIRDTRTYVVVNVVGALISLFLVALWAISPPRHELFPTWLLIGLAAFSFGGFVYQIIMRLTGRPVPLAWWARGKTDRQIWTVKYVVLACLAVIVIVLVLYRP